MKDIGEGFGLPKCVVHSRETRRAEVAELKFEGRSFKFSRCTHVLKEGALL